MLIACLLLVAPLFAGCMTEDAPQHEGLTLIQAHELAWREALRLDRGALLAGFLAQEAGAGAAGEEWLREHAGEVPAGGAHVRDGSADHWVLLFVTPQGRVLRAQVSAAPLGVTVDWAKDATDPVAQAIWAMNLGGRLVVDSTTAMDTARRDPAVAAHLDAHPDAAVTIAATVTEVDAQGTRDLAYAFYWGPPHEEAGRPFTLFAQVHHFSGAVVAVGDASEYHRARRVALVDETFTMGPVPYEVFVEEESPVRVTEAIMHLAAEGAGRYTVRLLRDNVSEIARIEGVAAVEPEEHERGLGTLEPGSYTLHIEVLGRVTFHLRIEGLVPVPPSRGPA